MTKQTEITKSLGGSPTGMSFSRICTLTLAATLMVGGATTVHAQAPADTAKPAVAKKPAAEPTEKISHGYLVHQSIELGGRFTTKTGSSAMWDTLVNQGTGGRVLGQSLELHSADKTKTPFFDTLTSSSSGFGGDPYDLGRLNLSKGRFYDFAGTFRRDRNYFDYNQFTNSLLTTYTATAPVLVNEPSTLHLYNTVRRNTDAMLTLFPISFISFRAGMNHGTHEGPTLNTVHNGGDVQVAQWFRNSANTYTGGIDLKLAKRTTLSYDQFFVFYKGDTSSVLTGANYVVNTTTIPVSLGVDVLGGTTTCGSLTTTVPKLTTLPLEVSNGVASQYCNGTQVQSQVAPTRTSFPTEQVRFSSHYFDRVAFNGRFAYTGDTSTINGFNESFTGLGRGNVRQTILTGNGPSGRFARNTRVNTSGDFGAVAEINKFFSVTDSVTYRYTRNDGYETAATQTWTGVAGTAATKTAPAIPTTTQLTPLTDPTITFTTPSTTVASYLNETIAQNLLLVTATLSPEFKISGGWRYKTREIADNTPEDLQWHENGLVIGTVMQPTSNVRINVNYDGMNAKSANPSTLSNTFTREAPNRSYHVRGKVNIKTAKWMTLSFAGSDFNAVNDDPLVNHTEHNYDGSVVVTVAPTEKFFLDASYAYDSVYSVTSLCYAFTANANAPLPAGAANAGTCSVANSPKTGSASYWLGSGLYSAPSNFFMGSVNYAPTRYLRFNGGIRLNDVNGSAELLNPLMVPGALQSHYTTPFADVVFNIARQWAWHGNWVRTEYNETGAANTTLPIRNVTGDVVSLGVKYAF